MLKEIIATGKDINIAKENARAALGAGPLDDVNFEIIDLGSRGFLGFMAKPAKVKATMEIPDVHEPRPRKERPVREKTEGETKEKKNNTNNNNGAKKNNNNKKSETKKQNVNVEAKKSDVVPETELKMERREVKDGEDMSYEFVKTVIADIGLSAEATLYSCEDGTRRITIAGDDASVLIRSEERRVGKECS